MGWVDVAILAIIIAAAVFGGLRGLIIELGGIVGAVAGLFLARHEYKTAESFLSLFFHKDPHLAMAGFVLVFVVVLALVGTLAQVVKTAVRFTPFAMLDRLGGAVLGFCLGLVTVEMLLLLAAGVHDHSLHVSIAQSHLAPIFRHTVPGLRSLIPKYLARA